MTVTEQIPLIDELLAEWRPEIGRDFDGYRNHVYRVVNFCFAHGDFGDDDKKKIVIAGCFHDLGIWSDMTFDYIRPSIARAKEYLLQNDLHEWSDEIGSIIGEHHKLRRYAPSGNTLVEAFRRADLTDVSLGILKSGLSSRTVRDVRQRFPNAGFHKCLLRVSSKWFIRHPLNPVPVLKW